jgi:hypothetical protein
MTPVFFNLKIQSFMKTPHNKLLVGQGVYGDYTSYSVPHFSRNNQVKSFTLLFPGYNISIAMFLPEIKLPFFGFFLVIGIAFSVVAGLMVFLISYSELVKHFPTKSYPRKLALQSALSAFLFFLGLSFLISLFLLS